MANFNSIFNREWTAYHIPKGGSRAYPVTHKIDGIMHYFFYDGFEITFTRDKKSCRLVYECHDGWINFWFSFEDKPRTIKTVCDYIDRMQRTSESLNSMVFKFQGFFEPFE